MREFAKIPPKIWIDENSRKIKKLGIEAQLVALYLLTNPHANMLGVYYLPITFIAHEVGLSTELATISLIKLCDIGYCSYDSEAEFVWVHDMGLTQIASELKAKDNRVKNVNETFLSLPCLCYLKKFYDKYADVFLLEPHHSFINCFQETSKPLRGKENDNNKENKKEKENENVIDSNLKITTKDIFRHDVNKTNIDISHAQATEVLEFLNEFAHKAYEPTNENIKYILERIMQGETVEICRSVIVRKTRQWLDDSKMDRSLNPITLFKNENYYRYKGELVAPNNEVKNESK